jgi:hypothetical protein
MMYFCLFFCLLLWPCILARHFVFIWDVQTLTIVYMTFVVLWMVLVFFYGYVHGCVYGCVWVCVWGMCLGYVYGYRVSILREAWFNKYRGLPLLGARFHHHWDLLASRGLFHHRWDLLASRGPFHHYRVLLLHEAHFIIIGSYSFTRPI